MTTREVAELLHTTPRKIQQNRKAWGLPLAFKIGVENRYYQADILRWLDAKGRDESDDY